MCFHIKCSAKLSARYSKHRCILVYTTSCYTTTIGVASINSIMCLQFGKFYKKVVLRLGEHGDIIETQTIRFVPQKVV